MQIPQRPEEELKVEDRPVAQVAPVRLLPSQEDLFNIPYNPPNAIPGGKIAFATDGKISKMVRPSLFLIPQLIS